MNVQGTEADRILLRSAANGRLWPLTLLSSVEQAISYVDVQDSDADAGTTVLAYDSLGKTANNHNWQFLSSSTPAVTNTWTGGVNSGWLTPGNWSAGYPPNLDDWIVISNNCSFYPFLTQSLTARDVTIQSGAMLELGGYALTVTNDLTVAGILRAAASETITLQGDVDFSGGTFDAAQSTVLLAATADQTVQMDGCLFYRIVAENPDRTLSVYGGFTADRFTCDNESVDNITLAFEPGKTVRLNQLRLHGHSTEKSVHVQGTTIGASWLLTILRFADVQNVAASACDASSGETVYPLASDDLGGNVNWTFDADLVFWIGPTTGDFATAANWSGLAVPDMNSRVILTAAATVTVSQEASVGSLVVGGAENRSTLVATAPLVVAGALTVRTNGMVSLDRPSEVGGDLWLLDNGILTHSPNPTTEEPNKLDLTVLGNALLEPWSLIDVRGMGFQRSKGNFGTHGGVGTYDSVVTIPCYGSVLSPTNCGMRGGQANGGGAIRLSIGGSLANHGTITASAAPWNTYNGAGGSVWIQATTLSGEGMIEAKGAESTAWSGAGGRISLILTHGDFSNFTGTVSADTHAAAGGKSSAGTIYRQTASQAGGRGTVTIWQEQPAGASFARGTQLPPTNGIPGELNRAVVQVEGTAILSLIDNLTVRDIQMPDSTAELWLQGYTLTVKSREHALTGIVTPAGGQIVWVGSGLGSLIMIR